MKILSLALLLFFSTSLFTGCGNGRNLEETKSNENHSKYICVGDSTRAKSGYGGQYLFYELSRALSDQGIQAILLAEAGQSLHQFVNNSGYPTISSLISHIPDDGEGTIVDISLGINDEDSSAQTLTRELIYAVEEIEEYKPETRIILTTPNRQRFDWDSTQKLRTAYHQAADYLGVELITVVDSLSPNSSWYKDDGIHLSKKGQHQLAQFILEQL